jgi:hypothetical protein
MTKITATPENIISFIERFPDYIQKQFLIDRMDMHYGRGFLPDETNPVGFRLVRMDVPKEANELLQFKLGYLRRCDNIFQVFLMINKPDRLQLLHLLKGVYIFDKKEYSKLLRDCWVSTEFPHQMSNRHLIDLFNSAYTESLMTKEEVEALGAQPEIISIYRGVSDKRTKHKALSWTISYKVANWFAHRWNKASGTPKILKSSIRKSDVYMYTNARNEEEIVVNPNRLKKIEVVI